MGNLEVVFDVPKWIEKGLASGVLKRVGGVIVRSGSRQVVAWLRDGSAINKIINVGSNVPSPFGVLLSAGRSAVTLWDNRMTRNAVNAVGQQVAQVAGQINGVSQQISQLTLLTNFMVTGQVINLGLSAATFYATMKRLDKLSNEIIHLGEQIHIEFDRDRDVRFKRALQAARDVFESENASHRDHAIRSAVDGLFEARENFLIDFDSFVTHGDSYAQLQLARHSLIRAMYAAVSRIRCYIAAEDFNLAKQRLSEDIPLLRDYSQRLINTLLGDHPAVFMHRDVSPEDMDRFLQIQRWMYQDDPFTLPEDGKIVFAIMNDLRKDFWNVDLVQDQYENPLQQFARRPAQTFGGHISKLVDRLSESEVIIENCQRIFGFGAELQSLPFNFQDWERFITDEQLAETGLAIVYDTDVVDQLAFLQN
jgi:hypothetical protein